MAARRSGCSANTVVCFEPYSATTHGQFLNDEDTGAPVQLRPGRPNKTDAGPGPRGLRGFRLYRNGLLNVTPLGSEIAIVKRNARDSPLLRLPAEIREVIWNYVFTRHEITPRLDIQQLDHSKILQVCRQIYVEATPIYRALTTISLRTASSLERTLKRQSLHGLHVHVEVSSTVVLNELGYVRRKMAGRCRSITFTVFYHPYNTIQDQAEHERAIKSHFHGVETNVQHKVNF